MRILQVAHGFPPRNTGGVEVFTRALSRELAHQGHQVEVFHRIAEPGRAEYDVERSEVGGLPVVRVNNTLRDCDRFERLYRNEALDRAFAETLDGARPDVVHFHHLTHLSTGLVREAHARRIPIVFTLHDYWLSCQRGQLVRPDLSRCDGPEEGRCAECLDWELDLERAPTGLRRAVKRATAVAGARAGTAARRVLKRSYRAVRRTWETGDDLPRERVRARAAEISEIVALVDRFVAPSEHLRRRSVGFGVPEERIVRQPYGFDLSLHGRPRPDAGGSVRFGYLGSWMPTKGVHLLIEAFLRVEDPRARLHLHGGPAPYAGFEDYEARLRRQARSPRVLFEGPYEPGRVGAVLAGLDVVVVPSIWEENSPLTIQEAMLSGLPVLASDVGGIPELVEDGESGLTFPAGDVAALEHALRRLLDDDVRRGLRPDAARVRSIADVSRSHGELYRSLQNP